MYKVLLGGLVAIVLVFAAGTLTLIYLEGYDGTPFLEKTVIVNETVPGVAMERNPGFIDTNGDGYLLLPTTSRIYQGEKYKVQYFCGRDDNLRKVIGASRIVPTPTVLITPEPTPDPFLCHTINGVCS